MFISLVSTIVVAFASWSPAAAVPQDKVGDPLRFKTPQEALDALLAATEARDRAKLRVIFGVEAGELGSGDDAQDEAEIQRFAKGLAAAAKFNPDGEDRMILEVGTNGYEFPVPLVRKNGTWFFDTPAGKEELLNRRIGENEIRTLAVCRGYVAAQRDYYAEDFDGDGVIEYAQRIRSSPGKKDGLYWETGEDEPASPLGPAVAEAQKSDDNVKPASQPTTDRAAGPRPYRGYHYKILTRQGEHAAGGKFDYVINGNMVAGFALVAWPAEWGQSGVMTFVVNSNGKVYEKNLGEKTAELAAKLTEYDPDNTWAVSKD